MTAAARVWIRWICGIILLAGTVAVDAAANPLDSLAVGQWFQIPNSRLDAVLPNPIPPGATGPEAIMIGWSGGAFDTQRNRLMIWGGGHNDYSGNELYAFNVNTLAWTRLTNPSSDVGGSYSSGYYPDGKPRSRHTENMILYVPNIDSFCSFGATAGYPTGQIMGTMVDCFNLQSLQWERKANALDVGPEGPFTAYDPTTGRVWAQSTEPNSDFMEYNPLTNTWTGHAFDNSGWTRSFTAAIDWRRRKFVAIGYGRVRMWDLNNPNAPPTYVTTSGATTMVDEEYPGFVYDPASDRFVAWDGGSDVYSLNLDTSVWTRHVKISGPTPPAAPSQGTFGRFQYVPSKNIFVAVSGIDQNVYAYKLTSGTIGPTDVISPAVPGSLIAR